MSVRDLWASVGEGGSGSRTLWAQATARSSRTVSSTGTCGWKNKFAAGIDLYSCSAAFIGPGSSDGNVFRYSMAKILNTFVRASTAKQLYTPALPVPAWTSAAGRAPC